MDRTLSLAQQHVTEGRRIVERQREIARQHEVDGRDAERAEAVLDAFERTLAIFEEHLRSMMQDAR